MYAVIRTKGTVGIRPQIRTTLEKLMLHKANHLVLVAQNESMKKMLKKAEAYITWGEINEETLEKLLKKRARLPGNKRATEETLKQKKLGSFKKIAEEMIKENKKLASFGLKPVIRLNPPSKGFEKQGIKKSFTVGGVWGYRAQDINTLVKRMM